MDEQNFIYRNIEGYKTVCKCQRDLLDRATKTLINSAARYIFEVFPEVEFVGRSFHGVAQLNGKNSYEHYQVVKDIENEIETIKEKYPLFAHEALEEVFPRLRRAKRLHEAATMWIDTCKVVQSSGRENFTIKRGEECLNF